MLATLPGRVPSDADEFAAPDAGEDDPVPVAVARMSNALAVEVVDVVDVLLAVVSTDAVGGGESDTRRRGREPTGLSVCEPLGWWVLDWDGGGETGGAGRVPKRGTLIWGCGTRPDPLGDVVPVPDAPDFNEKSPFETGERPELELFSIDCLSAMCGTHQNNDGLRLRISRLVMKVTGC